MDAAASPSSAELFARIELILRRDLKLGPDVAIPPDMPFFGGDVDLDSLDILLLVTSVEKEFGVKIPGDAVGKEVFQNVGTLVSYIEKNRSQGGGGSAANAGAPAAEIDPLSRLPHADPFRFVTALSEVRAGESAAGTWAVTGGEAFFAGHFPGNPIVPGVLIAEALAQISGLAGAGDAPAAGGMLAHADVRFTRAVKPPAEIVLHAKLARTMGSLQQFEVSATVGGEVVASGSITLHRA